eukprot:scaffold61598_cov18-Tisochrysis_lutea.AAC.1
MSHQGMLAPHPFGAAPPEQIRGSNSSSREGRISSGAAPGLTGACAARSTLLASREQTGPPAYAALAYTWKSHIAVYGIQLPLLFVPLLYVSLHPATSSYRCCPYHCCMCHCIQLHPATTAVRTTAVCVTESSYMQLPLLSYHCCFRHSATTAAPKAVLHWSCAFAVAAAGSAPSHPPPPPTGASGAGTENESGPSTDGLQEETTGSEVPAGDTAEQQQGSSTKGGGSAGRWRLAVHVPYASVSDLLPATQVGTQAGRPFFLCGLCFWPCSWDL